MRGKIVVIGGGPAGAASAARLSMLGQDVLVLEKEHFPRFRLGESLLPQSLHILGELGVLDDVAAHFLVKRGAQFHDDVGNSTRFAFHTAFDSRIDYAFQVEREEFDTLLLARAAALGAEVRHGWQVVHALRDGERVVGVKATSPDGATHEIQADFVVDASGRDALFAHGARSTEKIPGLENAAFYTHVGEMPREDGEREGDVHIVMFGEGDCSGWFWAIPFKGNRTSIGAVVTRAWLKSRPKDETPDGTLKRAIDESRAMKRLMGDAQMLWPARVAADFSYRVKSMHGPGWIVLGDAGGFIDPLFSTGVHVALQGAWDGGPAIVAALNGDAGALDAWETRVRGGAEMFLSAVTAFYRGILQKYLFTDNPRTYLRRAITSMLSGDVFGDERYTKDMRARLATLLG